MSTQKRMLNQVVPMGKKCSACKTAMFLRYNGACTTQYCEANCGHSYKKICFHTLQFDPIRNTVVCQDCGDWFVNIRAAEAQGYDHSKVPFIKGGYG